MQQVYYEDISSKFTFFKGFGSLGGQSASLGSLWGHKKKRSGSLIG
jgi:hypothetical protein